jgi:DNA polymerase-3 subunit epsilon
LDKNIEPQDHTMSDIAEILVAPSAQPLHGIRSVVLDTETTGTDIAEGHRIVEIGCVEIIDNMPTGRELHRYINPQRTVPAGAEKIHGLSTEFLADKTLFKDIAGEIIDFLGDSPMIAHNSEFDRKFLNMEFERAGLPHIALARTVDTVLLARKKFPGSPVSLDALCRRFAIDRSHRTSHGALVDARLLARVYLELMGGLQRGLSLNDGPVEAIDPMTLLDRVQHAPRRQPRPLEATIEELAAHAEFLKNVPNALWTQE